MRKGNGKVRLYRTTIVIYTDEPTMVDGDEWDLSTLAREAEEGGAICASQTCEQVKGGEDVPEGVLSFFDAEGIDPSRPKRDDCSDWRLEQAMQAGMGLGVEAYNDAMGYGHDRDGDDE